MLQGLKDSFWVHARSSMWLRDCELEFRILCQSHMVLVTSHFR